jgi:hypothetical protein
LKIIRPSGIIPALTISLIKSTGGFGGAVTPAGSGRLGGVTKPAGGLKLGGNVPPETGVKLSGSLGMEPGVATTGTNWMSPVPTNEPSSFGLKSDSLASILVASYPGGKMGTSLVDPKAS